MIALSALLGIASLAFTGSLGGEETVAPPTLAAPAPAAAPSGPASAPAIDVVVDAALAPRFDAARLRELLLARLASLGRAAGPSSSSSAAAGIAPDCHVTLALSADDASAGAAPAAASALLLRARRGASEPGAGATSTVAAAEPGVMELELLRVAPRVVRDGCAAVASAAPASAISTSVDEPPARALVAPAADVAVVETAPAPAPAPAESSHAGAYSAVLVRDGGGGQAGVDEVVGVNGGLGLLRAGALGLAAQGAFELVGGLGDGVASTEAQLAFGPGIDGALFGGTARVSVLVGPRLHTWWGTGDLRAIPFDGRTDIVVLVPASWTTVVGPVEVGASLAFTLTQVERELRFGDDVLWYRGTVGARLGVVLGFWRGARDPTPPPPAGNSGAPGA